MLKFELNRTIRSEVMAEKLKNLRFIGIVSILESRYQKIRKNLFCSKSIMKIYIRRASTSGIEWWQNLGDFLKFRKVRGQKRVFTQFLAI